MKNPRVIALRPELRAVDSLVDRTDDELMLLARAGGRTAFDTLIRRHQRSVLGLAKKFLGDAWLAEDAAQAAFLDLHHGVTRYEARGQFKAYLARIVINKCKMARRSAVSCRRTVERLEAVPPEPHRSLTDAVLRREQRQSVEKALLKLSKRLRMVVVLRYVNGFSYQEIADTLELPLGTVKSRLAAGMTKLRRHLEGDPS